MDNKREHEIIYGSEAREALKKGIDRVANAVKVTLGAQGRNVLISNSNGRPPHITKDGVTVANSIEVVDPLERQGALVVKEVSKTTNSVAGDGTTTATVLTQVMCNTGLELMNDPNINVMKVKKGMEFATSEISNLIKSFSVSVDSKESIKNVATISANNDEFIGGVIADAYEKIGKHGVISIDNSENAETSIEYVDGYQFDRGLITPYFITDPERMRSVLQNPYIIVTDQILTRADDFTEIMNTISREHRSVIVICDDMEFGCVQDFLKNHTQGFLKMAVVKAPEFGDRRYDMLQDICTVTGAKFVSKEKGDDIRKLTIEDLGEADSVIIDMDNTTIVGGQGSTDLIKQRVKEISALKEGKKGYEQEIYEKRLGKLTGGAAVIRIGAKTEVDLKELKDRVEDALSAVKASIEEGVLIGGGAFLYRIFKRNYTFDVDSTDESFLKGCKLVLDSLGTPIQTILSNGGNLEALAELDAQMSGNDDFGIDVMTGEVVNMFEKGIIDPAKVVRTTVENAVSIASTLLLTEVIVLGDDYSINNPREFF